ncbi:GCN5-related N-acetyltransferase [Gloeothece citriformis PCC 7424]|uniref:GCN5-related N-acetyltransferase n=1 Tax=Gloeothece citriformis (strain PCC 7424) TaxID=65393 RepID=B7K7X9_GLOC7|nr:hypothetical protein [Gloeothece citriformis]ACK71175.1 GCN5-related N-acetyltransferase [Gloeothece citriformis PCC 7424]
MTINLTDIEVRLARSEDKETVLAFCEQTWENQSDYIHLVWDKWLGESQSHLFVAIVARKPVALKR